MASYNSSDTFQELSSTESNGYNLFPGAYMSKGVGGSASSKNNRKGNRKGNQIKKGGDCGCSKMNSPASSSKLFGGRKSRRSKKEKKEKKNKTRKDRQ